MINYKYRLVNTTCRSTVNLTNYNTGINAAIREILPNVWNIHVHNGYYSFDLRVKASRQQLIQLGRALVKVHSDFITYMKIVTYKVNKVSRQLFRRF